MMKHRDTVIELLRSFDSVPTAKKFIEGVLDGLQFGQECDGNTALVVSKIDGLKNHDIEGNQIFERGFSVGLKYALEITEKSPKNSRNFHLSEMFPHRLQFDFNWELMFVTAINDAFTLAVENQNAFLPIKNELEITNKRIFEISQDEQGSLRTTKGEYQLGYRTGLEEAIKLLT